MDLVTWDFISLVDISISTWCVVTRRASYNRSRIYGPRRISIGFAVYVLTRRPTTIRWDVPLKILVPLDLSRLIHKNFNRELPIWVHQRTKQCCITFYLLTPHWPRSRITQGHLHNYSYRDTRKRQQEGPFEVDNRESGKDLRITTSFAIACLVTRTEPLFVFTGCYA